jgi:hypothetical protein
MKYPERQISNLIVYLSRAFLFVLIIPFFVLAGPPFLTDDPQPVDYMHWEFYVSSQQQFSDNNIDATLPHFEINYGLVPDVQVHLIVPMQYTKRESLTEYRYINTELGVKYRFINNSDSSFQVGVFPIAEIPTGKRVTLAGENKLQVFLPVWIQINSGKFISYGGVGYWINPGTGNKNWMYAGWQGQYDFSETVTLGGELFYHTADAVDSEGIAGINLGGYININEHNHILFSVGHSLSGTSATTGYVGYQVTI